MKILLLSAYDASSHQYWHRGLVEHLAEHQWQVLTLPGRYFSWRIRGNSLSWAFGEQRKVLEAGYDLIIATSMTDLSSLKGFVPALANTPSIVYFHENQFAYPESDRTRRNVEPLILNLYTALAADKLVFNSQYNYQTLIDGATALLRKLPDQVPANIITLLEHKSTVIAVPLQQIPASDIDWQPAIPWQQYLAADQIRTKPLLISWAARWEYDKGPDRLLAIIRCLEASGIDYRLAILGQSFRKVPREFEQLEAQFSHRIDQFGFAETPAQYYHWLSHSDLFLSTSVHEFQGLAVLEATSLGCVPILPKRLVYPELFDECCLYESHPDPETEAVSAVALIRHQAQRLNKQSKAAINSPAFVKKQLSWEHLAEDYRAVITACCQSSVQL